MQICCTRIITRTRSSTSPPTPLRASVEEMTSNSYQWPIERLQARKPSGVYEVEASTALAAEVAALHMKINSVLKIQGPTCEFCGGGHTSINCQVGASYTNKTTITVKSLDI